MTRLQKVEKWAKENGYEVELVKYQYWANVMKIGKTHIILHTSGFNSFSAITDVKKFPNFFTADDIITAINCEYDYVGRVNYDYKPLSGESKYYLCDDTLFGVAVCPAQLNYPKEHKQG